MSSGLFVNANTALAQTEEFFNFYGRLPFISLLTGYVRENLGYIQAVGGAAGWAVLKASSLVVADKDAANAKASRAWEYGLHGLLNMGRGRVEQVFLLGNVATYVYDNVCKARFAYRREEPQHVYNHKLKFPSFIRL